MDPWSKVDYSQLIREASMATENLPEVNPPSGRVPSPYNFLSGVCSEFFDLSCRSISLKLFSLCCSVFPRFCPCLSFRSFANLNLDFSLQNFWQSRETVALPKNLYF